MDLEKAQKTLGKTRLEIRVSPELKNKMVASAKKHHMTVSQYCGQILGDNRRVDVLDKLLIANKNIMKYQAKIGNNINQIARRCNESRVGPSIETIRLLMDYIEETKAELLNGE
ncbi:MAG: plasmid mobilization protein [Intestinibacter sp.]|uniref:plasmid mobilization protein n=1 Tax=Intestinibacter sp. TaxID=1965304 RepID=UPI003F180399